MSRAERATCCAALTPGCSKLRISLGLKPLAVGPTSAVVANKVAEDNYAALRDGEAKAAELAELQEKLAKARNKRELKKKLQGKGLGEADDAADSTLDSLAWVERMKRRQQELAERRQRELEEQDREAESAAKRTATASGLRVGHAVDSVLDDTGGETILVLKDSTIEENENEGDELVSLKLLESEQTKKRLEAGKKKALYDPAAEEHQGLLSQYDETISGPEKSAFVLGDEGTFSVMDEEQRRMEVAKKLREQQHGLKGVEMNLDYSKNNEIRDYYTQEEQEAMSTSFKKVKRKDKKKSRSGRATRIVDEDEDFAAPAEGEMDTRPDSFVHSNVNASIEDVNFVDDDDLQGALAKARRLAEKRKAKVSSTVQMADEILGRNRAPSAEPEEEGGMVIDIERGLEGGPVAEEEEDPDMVISDTANFVRSLPSMSVFQQQQAEQARKAELAAASKRARAAQKAEEEAVKIKEEPAEEGERMDWEGSHPGSVREGSAAPSDTKPPRIKREDEEEEEEGTHITEEPLVAAGLGATLALLSARGALDKKTQEDKIKEERIRQQQEWMKKQRIKELEKEAERKRERERQREKQQKGKGGGGHQWEDDEKTYADEMLEERKRMRELEDKFKSYKPEINIDYVDEFGRTMNQKEVSIWRAWPAVARISLMHHSSRQAFKFLSHRFHGKGSGKMKTEKRLQRIADEFQQKAASTADTPLGTVNALHERTKSLKQPHVVLQVGNRAAAAPDVAKLAPTASQKKKKEAQQPKPAEVERVVIDVPGGLTAQPVDSQAREKVTFGFGVKRKADALRDGSPAPSE